MRLRIPIIVTALYAISSLLMFGLLMPTLLATCGTQPLDTLPGWTRKVAQQLAAECGAAGLQAYQQVATLDLIYPLTLALFVGSWIYWCGQRLNLSRWVLVVLLIPTIVNMVSDYLENMAVWAVIRSGGAAPGALLDVGGTFTAIKTASGALSFTVVAVLAIFVLFVTLRGARTSKTGHLIEN